MKVRTLKKLWHGPGVADYIPLGSIGKIIGRGNAGGGISVTFDEIKGMNDREIYYLNKYDYEEVTDED